jgi:hypothetical protein
MIRFLDGPAEGVVLALEAAPEQMRVVRARNGTWDALDQPGDSPRYGEAVFTYRRVTAADNIGHVHVDMRVKGRRVGVNSRIAEYRWGSGGEW